MYLHGKSSRISPGNLPDSIAFRPKRKSKIVKTTNELKSYKMETLTADLPKKEPRMLYHTDARTLAHQWMSDCQIHSENPQ